MQGEGAREDPYGSRASYLIRKSRAVSMVPGHERSICNNDLKSVEYNGGARTYTDVDCFLASIQCVRDDTMS